MAGIYIHIPFCKQACHYCDFHFSTSLANKDHFLSALKKEIKLQKNYFLQEGRPQIVDTIYFGGGTPSLLSQKEIMTILDEVYANYSVSSTPEITLEANPDDLSSTKIANFSNTPINRFSVGIQSFFDEDLKFMNRAHSAEEAKKAIPMLQDAGFDNITIDLIYGTPTMSNDSWKQNLSAAFNLGVNHISAYSLTVEPQTALAHLVKTNKCENIDEEKSAQQFEIMLDAMAREGFVQYEISNFCKEGFYSQHNSNYWLKSSYLGLGPSAHSYNGLKRRWNISNNSHYIKKITEGQHCFEEEELTLDQRFNEYVLTALRTMWGVSQVEIEKQFGLTVLKELLQDLDAYFVSNHVEHVEDNICLTNQGKLIADKIASDLFRV